jgi:hypothetical protein
MIEEWKYLPSKPVFVQFIIVACSVWLSVNTGSQSWGYWVDSVDIVILKQIFQKNIKDSCISKLIISFVNNYIS